MRPSERVWNDDGTIFVLHRALAEVCREMHGAKYVEHTDDLTSWRHVTTARRGRVWTILCGSYTARGNFRRTFVPASTTKPQLADIVLNLITRVQP